MAGTDSASPTGDAGRQAVLEAKGLGVSRTEPADAGGEVVYEFSGNSRSSEPEFLDALGELRRRVLDEPAQVVLDVSRLELINSAFIGMLSGVVAGLDERGRRPVLVGPNAQIRDLLGIVGILDAFEIRPTADGE